MTTIVTRLGKGSALTWAEGDANFTNLNTDKVEKSGDTMTGPLAIDPPGGNTNAAYYYNDGIWFDAYGSPADPMYVSGENDTCGGGMEIWPAEIKLKTWTASPLRFYTNDVQRMEIGAEGNVSIAGNNISAENSLGFRNRIINGDMRIDQRRGGGLATITGTNAYTLDRWIAYASHASQSLGVQQTTITSLSGFTHCVRASVVSAFSSTSSDVVILQQRIEAFNVGDFLFGTAYAKPVTISFWVRSSMTGTFGVSIRNSAGNRYYVKTYTINAANTWEYKTLTFPGDTSGTWVVGTNGIGFLVSWDLGSGSDFRGTADTWTTGAAFTTSAQTNFINTGSATWDIAGIQLEAGSVATPFERRPYGMEWQLCQRYYQVWAEPHYYIPGTTATQFYKSVRYPLHPMRTTPTVTLPAATSLGYNASGTTITPTTWAAESVNADGFRFNIGHASGIGGHIGFQCIASAEL